MWLSRARPYRRFNYQSSAVFLIVLLIAYAAQPAAAASPTPLPSPVVFGAPQYADRLVGFVDLLVPGAVVTRLARNYGVEKSGWFGVGAKATFWLMLVVFVLAAGGIAVRYFVAR